MATAAVSVRSKRVNRPRRRQKVNLVVVHGDRELPPEQGQALLLDVSVRLREARETKLQPRPRLTGASDRGSVLRLMDAAEAHLVTALWTLACLPNGSSVSRCGIPYIHTREEVFANAVANGDWKRPRPGSPPPKAIDAMHRPLSWLEWLPRDLAAIVRAAANSKQGNPNTQVSWGKVRDQVVEARTMTIRTLQRRYETGLRTIAVELAFRREKL